MLDFARLPVIRQSEVSECGLACLGMIATFNGKTFDLPSLRRRFPVSIQGATLNDLIRIAQAMEFRARALRVELDGLKDVRLPAILHWDFAHFVVLKSISRNHVIIHDPALGERKVSLAELSASFTGVALELTPAPEFKREKNVQRIRLLEIFRQTTGVTVPLLQVLAFSLIIQAIALIIPFYSQLAIDKVVPVGDTGLLRVLALGFGIFYVLDPVVTWMRARLVIYVSMQLSAQLTANMVRALLALPLPFFEKRSIGDVLTRLEAAERLRELLSEGFVAILVDSLLAVLTLAMMFYYAPTLAVVVIVMTVLMAAIRLGFVPILQRLVNDQLQKQGSEQSELIETMRGITSIKFAQKELERESIWNRAFTGMVNSAAKLGLAQSNFELMRHLVQNVGYVLVVYLGIGFVIDPTNTFTVGAFFAFMSYQSMFFSRVESFLGQMIEFSMTRVHLERLSEIVFEEPEPKVSELHQVLQQAFKLQLDEVSYSFEADGRPLLQNISASVNEGDRIAIYAPSGTGKTTLLKLLTGIYTPNGGTITMNGTRITKTEMTLLRSQAAAVLQDDYLFKGSIVDNITFFDTEPDLERVMGCADLACVHEEIMSMPMNYESFVGEMGTSLSQGQQQRVLIARALYQGKPLLVLDEGTANLDAENEKRLLENLVKIGVTVIFAAHSKNVADYATHIWTIGSDKKLVVQKTGNRA